ncbi:MAG: SMC-Scp complex subunit ScpB [Acidobacteriota bacterium]
MHDSDSSVLYEAALEAVLFVSPDPVSRGRLLSIFSEAEQPAAAAALERLLQRYGPSQVHEASGRGVFLEEVAGGLRFVTRPDLNEWLRRFFEASNAKKLSMGALETLAIVAYRQPVTSPEIQELRGVNPAGVLKTLLERRMVRIAGRKEVVGKPFLYATTQEFLVHFGLKNLKDLPPLEEFEEALAAAGEGLGELLGGVDSEEAMLQEAAAAEQAEADSAERQEQESIEEERAQAMEQELAEEAAIVASSEGDEIEALDEADDESGDGLGEDDPANDNSANDGDMDEDPEEETGNE